MTYHRFTDRGAMVYDIETTGPDLLANPIFSDINGDRVTMAEIEAALRPPATPRSAKVYRARTSPKPAQKRKNAQQRAARKATRRNRK